MGAKLEMAHAAIAEAETQPGDLGIPTEEPMNVKKEEPAFEAFEYPSPSEAGLEVSRPNNRFKTCTIFLDVFAGKNCGYIHIG